jgi:sporulation protein YhbH
MNNGEQGKAPSHLAQGRRWYDLFSRGARDWLRHNDKVRETVREKLPELVAGGDILSRPSDRTVRLPVRFLEHYRFRLRDADGEGGVGQGQAKPGDVYRRASPGGEQGEGGEPGPGGSGDGSYQFVLELQVDDIVDWLWQELELPDLKPKMTDALTNEETVQEGWNRRGPRARLDRRRTVKEAIKRRAAQTQPKAFTDEDLRFRQLAQRKRPAMDAVVAFVLDVSASMDEYRRKLAKSFFFWAMQGLRRQYGTIETVFIAHTNKAWEFTEEEFFQVTATGGTVASSAFTLALDIFTERFQSARYNQYLFYASDGDNFGDDRGLADALLARLGAMTNFMGFVETPQNPLESARSETGRLFRSLVARGYPVASYTLHQDSDIWDAIRSFFRQQAEEQETG